MRLSRHLRTSPSGFCDNSDGDNSESNDFDCRIDTYNPANDDFEGENPEYSRQMRVVIRDMLRRQDADF